MMLLAAVLAAQAQSQSFEAASVKPYNSMGKEKFRTLSLSPGGVTFRNVDLHDVIRAAYGLKDYQIVEPAWLRGQMYEIIAKTAAPASDEELKKMLQGLLAERFQLAAHRESRERPVYIMTAAKKTAALRPSAGTGEARMVPAPGGFAFENYTMPKLVEYLGRMRLDRPVFDETGLEGAYDFTIVLGDPSGDAAEAKRAVETAFRDASLLGIMASQLGLKFETRKTPIETLVIDRIERPSAN